MAVTSIWPVKGRVDRVINYAQNPEKTIEASYEEQAALHVVDDVVEYAADEMKTERRSYVSCLNCREDTAAVQFMETKRLWGKLGGRMCYHGYQSFKADEVTAETAHEIGVKLAQELWGDRFEVVVATHCNTGHYHNHFVINSVSWADGYKFYNSPADYARMREVSDRLCKEYGLSVVKQPEGKSKSYGEWQAEKKGRFTHRGSIRADIDRAILASTTQRDFIQVMTEMGYEFKTRAKDGQPLKHPALKPPDARDFFRFYKLGKGYDLEEIKERILQNIRKQVPFPEVAHRPCRRYRLKGKPRKRLTGLQALYFRYCYELHILRKKPASVSSPQSPLYSVSAFSENCVRSLASPLPTKSLTLRGPRKVSFLLREDVAKLDRLDQETLFLAREDITTIGQANIYFKYKGKKPLTEAEQILFTTAKDYLKGVMNGKTTIPTKAWKEEYTKLTAERKTLNQRYLALKEEVKEAEKIRKSVYSILRQEQREQQPHRKQDMER